MKIGVGICTYNRQLMFEKTLQSIVQNLSADYEFEIVIVNDGTPYPDSSYKGANHVIQNQENIGVGRSKNKLFKHLISKNYQYYFIIEDDILVLSSEVWKKYIEASKVSGIQHFSFFGHGPMNFLPDKKTPNPRLIVNYTKEIGIALYLHSIGAFSFFTKYVLEKVGLHDEYFINSTEHIELTRRIELAGYTTPFWNFADIKDSQLQLCEQACSEVNSTIRPRADWKVNIARGWEYFKQKYGCYPTELPDTPQEEVIKVLKQLKK
jgi:glycosyltransferase involved in cell wall biosynthesis